MNWVTLQLYLTLIFILMIISLHSVLLGKIILLSCTNPSKQVGWESFCIPANDIMQHNKNNKLLQRIISIFRGKGCHDCIRS